MADHVVVLDGTHPLSAPGCIAFLCNHCGVRVVVKLPVAVGEFSAIGESFGSRHRGCSIVAPDNPADIRGQPPATTAP